MLKLFFILLELVFIDFTIIKLNSSIHASTQSPAR